MDKLRQAKDQYFEYHQLKKVFDQFIVDLKEYIARTNEMGPHLELENCNSPPNSFKLIGKVIQVEFGLSEKSDEIIYGVATFVEKKANSEEDLYFRFRFDRLSNCYLGNSKTAYQNPIGYYDFFDNLLVPELIFSFFKSITITGLLD